MAEAAASAAEETVGDEFKVILKRAKDTLPDDLLNASGYLFCCPENLAAISGEMKEFFDICYYPLLGKIEGRPYAQMICAGSDGENAVRQLARIATGWRLKEVQKALIICTHAQTQEEILAPKQISSLELKKCSELGAALAAGIEMGAF